MDFICKNLPANKMLDVVKQWVRAYRRNRLNKSDKPFLTYINYLLKILCLLQILLSFSSPLFANETQKQPKIEISKMQTSQIFLGPYSYFVPPYSTYYFHNMDKLGFHQDWIRRANIVYKLHNPNPKQAFALTYEYNNHSYTLEEYYKRNNVLGFLVLKDNQIIIERYFHNANQQSHFLSNSIHKSITSTLFGIALQEGKIASIDDPIIKYLPSLKNSGYNRVTLKQTLEMATGIAAAENYTDPNSSIYPFLEATIHGTQPFIDFISSLRANPKIKPGTVFNYESVNTEVIGLVIEKATNMPLNKYMQEKIWTKIGTESDAYLYRAKSQPDLCAFGCFNATLRDYGRFGLMMMNGGVLGKTHVVGSSWVKEATRFQIKTDPNNNQSLNYGYQWWILPNNQDSAYQAIGIFGQLIYINPSKHIVIVETSAWPARYSLQRWKELSKVIDAIVAKA